jgi:hypothetical protein
MCDANKRFLWMSMNTAGATHDQLAWRSSYMAERIALGQLPDPFCITPDAAYVASNSVVTPFSLPLALFAGGPGVIPGESARSTPVSV